MENKVHFFGAGSIGGFFAAHLIKRYGPEKINVIEKNPALSEMINRKGFDVSTAVRTFHTDMKVTPLEEFKQDESGFYVIATKQYDTFSALNRIPEVNRGILFLQNGYNHETAAQFDGQVSFGVLGVTHNKLALNSIHQVTQGKIYIGNPSRKSNVGEKVLADFFNDADIPAENVDDYWPVFWSKLCRNATSNPLAAMSGRTLGELLADKKTAKAVVNLYGETSEIARCELERLGYNKGLSGMNGVKAGEFEKFRALAFKPVVGRLVRALAKSRLKDVKTSMSDDIERGFPTEVSYINGFVCKVAGRTGTKSTYNEKVVKIMSEIEQNKRTRTIENLEELFE
jgi:2-dehydropantoate 2-reductase